MLKMPLSKNIIEKENADTVAINYQPVAIDAVISEETLDYVQNNENRTDFRVDKIVAEYVGIDELEKESQQKEIAVQALKLSKDVQEKAYAEAYALGLVEGEKKAYDEEKERVNNELVHIKSLIDEIKVIKTNLMKENEKQIVNLCLYLAKRLMMKEVNTDEAYIQGLIKKSLEMAQSDEEVTIRVSSEDNLWIEKHHDTIFKELNLDSSTKVEADESISRGGVIIETNHGVIDATIEQRFDKLESILKNQS